MTTGTLAYATPEVLRWARESAGLTLLEAAARIGVDWFRLEGAERGEDNLTLREAEEAAKIYERPLALLFAPEVPDEAPPEVQFRMMPGAPDLPWETDMHLFSRRIRERQEAALEMYEGLGEGPPWPEAFEVFRRPSLEELPALARQMLGVEPEEHSDWQSDRYAPLRAWRSAVEAQGALVMQHNFGEDSDQRGFLSLAEPSVPVIVLSSPEDPRARAFTILHEFGHLLLEAREESFSQRTTEQWSDNFAGEVLMPRDQLVEVVTRSAHRSHEDAARDVARTFHVTPLAAAVRMVVADLVPKAIGDDLIVGIRARGGGGQKPTGGSYYRNQIANFGGSYIGLVFHALDQRVVTYSGASALLDGVKIQNFDKLRKTLAEAR